MRVHFVAREGGPERLVSEAEIHFEEGRWPGARPLGFVLWKSPEGELYLTFPSRATGARSERSHFEYLCSGDGQPATVKRIKDWVLAEYRKQSGAAA
jgi:hypothetical protein